MLIFGLFQRIDLIIFAVGISVTLGILVISSSLGRLDNLISILGIIPGLTATFLVFPFPNYHNIRTAIGELVGFYTNRRKYVWRGWCMGYEFKNK